MPRLINNKNILNIENEKSSCESHDFFASVDEPLDRKTNRKFKPLIILFRKKWDLLTLARIKNLVIFFGSIFINCGVIFKTCNF